MDKSNASEAFLGASQTCYRRGEPYLYAENVLFLHVAHANPSVDPYLLNDGNLG